MRYTRYSRRYTRYTCDIHGDIRDICDITAISPIYARCTRYTARCTRYTARCTRYTRYPARYTRYARYTPIYTISRAIYAIYTRYKTEKLKSACAGPWLGLLRSHSASCSCYAATLWPRARRARRALVRVTSLRFSPKPGVPMRSPMLA